MGKYTKVHNAPSNGSPDPDKVNLRVAIVMELQRKRNMNRTAILIYLRLSIVPQECTKSVKALTISTNHFRLCNLCRRQKVRTTEGRGAYGHIIAFFYKFPVKRLRSAGYLYPFLFWMAVNRAKVPNFCETKVVNQ